MTLIEKLVQTASEATGIPTEELLSSCRERRMSVPRQVVMWAAAHAMRPVRVAEQMGFHYATVYSAQRKVEFQRHVYPEIGELADKLLQVV